MKLLIFVLNDVEKLDKLLKEFAKQSITGATVISSSGMVHELSKSNDETLASIVGSLRKLFNPNDTQNKTIFMAIKQEKVNDVVNIIESVVGSLDQPNSGIVFTLPIDFIRGMKH
jgi:nitrogen regulatory protein PII